MQGTNLKNTKFVVGMVLYAGFSTKIMMNQKSTPFKRSIFQTIMNNIVIFQLLIQTGLCLFLAISSVSFENENINAPYSNSANKSPASIGSESYFAFFILLNSLIPISMMVSLEIVRLGLTILMQMDLKMYSEQQDRPCKVQSISILEELGSVNYMFCDKTGTLTANVMEFKGCNIAGYTYMGIPLQPQFEHIDSLGNLVKDNHSDPVTIYDIINDNVSSQNYYNFERIVIDNQILTQKDIVQEFLTVLLVCNDIVTDKSDTEIKYLSSSPDEIALIKAAKTMGYEFIDRNHLGITANINGIQKFFEVLAINEFSAERKRMSVLIKHPDDNSVRLYIKGADEALMKLLVPQDFAYLGYTNIALTKFAEQGLRTLDIAYKPVNN